MINLVVTCFFFSTASFSHERSTDTAEEDGATQDTRLRALLRVAMRRVRHKNELFAQQLHLTERDKIGTASVDVSIICC